MRPLCALAAVVVLVDLAVLTRRSFESDPATAEPTTTTTTTTLAPTTTLPPVPHVPASTPLAKPNGIISTYDAPAGRPVGTVGVWYGYPMTMPIVEHQGDWLRIMLPERPNGSTAWVRAADVTQSSTPYRIVVHVDSTSVMVFQNGDPIFTVPAGLGVARTPTPLGSFFVAVIEKPGPRGYGPIVLDTSAHSEAIRSWEGSGDAVIALHGPITAAADAQIGDTGTYISNGCIRLHPDDQLRFDGIPLGTPIDIVS